VSRADTGFPRERRIRRSVEFRELGRRGRRRSSACFALLTAHGQAGQARLGVTVSRRVGNAVVRNRVKRRIREWFRADTAARASGLDLVVIARSPAARLAPGATGSELDRLFEASQ